MTEIDNEYMKKACHLAEYSIRQGGGPFGAIIIDKNGDIIDGGHNRVTIDNDPTQHAEIVAIRNVCKKVGTFDLRGYSIYTSCEPCPMCLSAIYWARIDKIYYGNTRNDAKEIGFDDDFIYDEINKDLEHRKIPIVQVNREQAQISFRKWMEKEDKIKY
jgi:tRNA(Arg) A34 adenosine deaminase TadA